MLSVYIQNKIQIVLHVKQTSIELSLKREWYTSLYVSTLYEYFNGTLEVK